MFFTELVVLLNWYGDYENVEYMLIINLLTFHCRGGDIIVYRKNIAEKLSKPLKFSTIFCLYSLSLKKNFGSISLGNVH